MTGLLRGSEPVIAQLRRKQRIAERTALFANLQDARDRSMTQWKAAEREMNANCVDGCTAPPWIGEAVTPASLAQDDTDFEEITRVARYANWPQYQTKEDKGPQVSTNTQDSTRNVEAAARTFYTLQSTPSLARAFLLAIDVIIKTSDIKARLVEAPFGQISVVTGACAATCQPQPWTLFQLQDSETGRPFFWPATRGEANCHDGGVTRRNATRQWRGLMVMGFGSCGEPAQHVPRFDITSLEVRTALELELQRRATLEADRKAKTETQGGNTLAPGQNAASDPASLADEGDRQDVGLTILDRGLAFESIRKMVAKSELTKMPGTAGAAAQAPAVCHDGEREAVVLDAEDLTTGYRLFVGAPAGTATNWRPLMARSIRFGSSGGEERLNRAIENVLSLLIGKAGSNTRIALESAMMTVPGRMLPKAPAVAGTPLRSEAVFEQAVSVWDGGPMGVDCAEVPGQHAPPDDTLVFGRTLSLPQTGKLRPPRLRYGRPYRFALAAVYSGGHSVPEDDFPVEPALANVGKSPIADLYYPSAGMVATAAASLREAAAKSLGTDGTPKLSPYVRATRQSKIGAPHTLLPEGHALRLNGPMGPEEAGKMVIRSLDASARKVGDARLKARANPSVSQRLVLVPSMPQASAAMHADLPSWKGTDGLKGALDGAAFQRKGPPPGAWQNVQQTEANANFPAVKTAFLTGFNGRDHIDRRILVPEPGAAELARGEVLSGSVFARRRGRASQYYPDPAADQLAVRLTLKGQHGRTCLASTQLVDLVGTRTYPDRIPVLLSVRPLESRKTIPTQCSDLITERDVTFDPALAGDITKGNGFVGKELELRLAPHEWVEIEMWFVPSAIRLARDFAVVQALALSLSQDSRGSIACTEADLVKGCKDQLPVLEDGVRKIIESSEKGLQAFFGPGGVALPPMRAILAVASMVRDCMKTHPIPEIGAVAHLQAVHAMNRAEAPPKLMPGDTGHMNKATWEPPQSSSNNVEPVRAFRPPPPRASPAEPGQAVPTKAAPVGRLAVCNAPSGQIDVAASGSTELILSGDVELDLNQVDMIEVLAKMPFPCSSTFDDRFRGRSLAQRRANWWPLKGNPAGAPADVPGADFLGTDELFGFDVAADGSVNLKTAEVTLLRAEGLPRPGEGDCTRRVSLRRLFEAQVPGVRVTERHIFPDGKARRMQLRINALPRSGEFMRTVDRRLLSGDPWIGTAGLGVGDLAIGEGLPAEAQRQASNSVEVILPATICPAKPNARAPEPSLLTVPEGDAARSALGWLVRRQHSILRLPLGREWWSSGQDEMLGIVLWPPNLTAEDGRLLAKNLARLREADPRTIDLNADSETLPFEDDFLGYGGRFVSRRGADPVREGLPHRQILFAPWDFPDLNRPPGDPRRAELVPLADMPLSDESGAAEDGNQPTPPPMQVALLTYRPRFDVDAEEWFVEVDLRESTAAETFVRFGLVRYQPHTRPALRCSRPVAQYVVPLAGRAASVRRLPEGGGVRVQVVGSTFHRRRFSEALLLASKPLDGQTAKQTASGMGLVEGPEAAPWMVLSLHRKGLDAAGRPYRETVPLPVPQLDLDARLLLPVDHDMGVIDGTVPIKATDSTVLAGSVSVRPRSVRDGLGMWTVDLDESVLGDLTGLSLTVREVIADEPATPPTEDELALLPARSLELSNLDTFPSQQIASSPAQTPAQIPAGAKAEPDTQPTSPAKREPPPGAPVVGRHTGGARFETTFDLSLLITSPQKKQPAGKEKI